MLGRGRDREEELISSPRGLLMSPGAPGWCPRTLIKHPRTLVVLTTASRKVMNSAPSPETRRSLPRFDTMWILLKSSSLFLSPSQEGFAWYEVNAQSFLYMHIFRTFNSRCERISHGQQNIHLCQRSGPGLHHGVRICERIAQKLAAGGGGFPEHDWSLVRQVSVSSAPTSGRGSSRIWGMGLARTIRVFLL